MCSRFYQTLQRYYANQEWALVDLAILFRQHGWYATVESCDGKLTLIVKGPKTLAKIRGQTK